MRRHFYFIMSAIFWFIMVIGFADNWLYDIHQESNSIPKFIIHGIFAFGWFTIAVIQTGLIRKSNYGLHQKIGIFGFLLFIGMAISTGYLFVSMIIRKGDLNPLSYMTSSQYLYAIVLAALGYYHRKRNLPLHKTNMLTASLFLIQAGVDRFVDHIFSRMFPSLGDIYTPVWFLVYFTLFGLFIWYYKRITWQLAIGILIWEFGFFYADMNHDF